MQSFTRRIALAGLAAALLLLPVLAQAQVNPGSGTGGQRIEGGGINYAPGPAIYVVVSVDADARTVQLRATTGRTGVDLAGELTGQRAH